MSNASGARGWGVLSGWMTVHEKTYKFVQVVGSVEFSRMERIIFRQHALDIITGVKVGGVCLQRDNCRYLRFMSSGFAVSSRFRISYGL